MAILIVTDINHAIIGSMPRRSRLDRLLGRMGPMQRVEYPDPTPTHDHKTGVIFCHPEHRAAAERLKRKIEAVTGLVGEAA